MGFLQRDFVGPITAAGHRVIVPDFLRIRPLRQASRPARTPVGPARAGCFPAVEAKPSAAYRDRPVRFVWAMKDPAFPRETLRDRWLKNLPRADVVELEDAGHFLREDADEVIVPQLLDFLAGLGA
ncbi:alpha/beta fold hydrolase [Catenulispora rubra]|uniref:alpha/beta fold hydrolase n=1 Tax=Catenulispora rubra TaxID=280293 RepID=UPI0018921B0A|nr:alpha/beta hydrolase [Catenulispora rubra]